MQGSGKAQAKLKQPSGVIKRINTALAWIETDYDISSDALRGGTYITISEDKGSDLVRTLSRVFPGRHPPIHQSSDSTPAIIHLQFIFSYRQIP